MHAAPQLRYSANQYRLLRVEDVFPLIAPRSYRAASCREDHFLVLWWKHDGSPRGFGLTPVSIRTQNTLFVGKKQSPLSLRYSVEVRGIRLSKSENLRN